MSEHVVKGVRGDLIRWARQQQEISMRWIRDHGGPSLGYQSEVEQDKKTEVSYELLQTWVKLLNVTEAYVRGQVPRYLEAPNHCRGLAASVSALVAASRTDWAAMDSLNRAVELLRLVQRESRHLPRVVLAYVLGLEVATLDGIVTGQHPLMAGLLPALGDLTALPESFIKRGVMPDPDGLTGYERAIRLAQERSIFPEQLEQMIRDWGLPPAPAADHRAG